VGPLHLSKCNFAPAQGAIIDFPIVDPVDDEAVVDEKSYMSLVLDQRYFMRSITFYIDTWRSFINDVFAWVLAQAGNCSSWQLGIVRVIGYMIILQGTIVVLTEFSIALR